MENKKKLCIVASSLNTGVTDFIKAQSSKYEIHLVYIDLKQVPISDELKGLIHSYPIAYKSKSYFLAEVGIFQTISIIPTLIKMYKQIKFVIRNYNIDIVHAHWSIPSGFLSCIANKNIPIVITLRGLDAKVQKKQFMFQPFVNYALKKSSHVIALSKTLRDEAIKIGVNPWKISLLPVGVDQTKFKPINKLSSRIKLGLPTNGFLIIYVGNLIKLKRVDKIINICNKLKNDFKLNLIILGDGPELENLKNLTKTLNFEDNIIFTGRILYNRVPEYLSAADVLMLLSESEGLPGCIQEAMSCGVPVITSNVGGLPDIITNGINGFMVSTDKEAEIYLKEILLSEQKRHTIEQSALNFAKDNFSLDKVLNNIDLIYNSILNNKKLTNH